MRIRDIQFVLAVAEHGSFSKAADTMGVSQPAVSQAVKRVEDEFKIRLFERSGYAVQVTRDGENVRKSLEKIWHIISDLKSPIATARKLKVGLSPLLSGRDATRLLREAVESNDAVFDVEFLDSAQMAARHDFDIRVAVPSLRRRSSVYVDFPTQWIGANRTTFIYSRQESEVWDMARSVLVHNGIEVDAVIEVNDCGYAYHMAAAGAGFTPCVMTQDISFRGDEAEGLPPLPPMRLDIFAPPATAAKLRRTLAGNKGTRG